MKRTVKTVSDLLAEKREARQKIYAAVTAGEGRQRTSEETEQWNALGEEVRSLEEELKFLKEGEQEARQNAQPITGGAVHGGGDGNKFISDRDQRELNKFSLGKVVRAKLYTEALDGIEADVLAEGRSEFKNSGAGAQGNVTLPYDLFAKDKEGRDVVKIAVEERARQFRDLTVTGGTAGSEGGLTVQTTLGRLYLALYNAIVLQNLGATFMTGMVGNYTIPRFNDPDDPAFKAENGTADESNPTFAGVTLTPKRLPTYVTISNQLLQQSEYNIAQVVTNGLINKLSSKSDRMGIMGSGTGNQPRGILNTTGIGVAYAGGATVVGTNANGAPIKWDDVVNVYKATKVVNANLGKLGYLTNPLVEGQMMVTPKMQNTAGIAILGEGGSTLNGRPLGITNNVPSNLIKGTSTDLSPLIFGNFEDLHMCLWGGIDLLINPYTGDLEGTTRINAALFMDSAVARAESFAVIKDIKA